MKLEEIREIKPDKEFQELFAATQPKAVFIPLVKARRPPHGISMSFEPVMDIKPWPTEQTEEEQATPLAEEEQATPLVFNKTFTLKIQKEDCQAFKRALDSHISCKGPRKLKKAAKHVRFDQFVCVVRRNGKDTVVGVEIFHTVNGYPYTKWVRKAIGRAYHERGIKPPKVYSSLEKIYRRINKTRNTMKITYPECQVEITAEEFITVIDHFTTKVTCNTEPTFGPGGIVGTGDDMPEPRPYPNLTDHEAIIQRGTGFQDLIMQGLKEAEDQGKLQGVQIPAEEEHAPTENKKEPAKRKTNSKKVQVLFENGWKTFNSISHAAKAIDARLNHLSHALLNGKTCNGHQVRYATGNKEQTQLANEEQTELP